MRPEALIRGGEGIADGDRGEGLAVQPGLLQQDLQPQPARVLQQLQALADQNAVFAGHLHHIGDGADGG